MSQAASDGINLIDIVAICVAVTQVALAAYLVVSSNEVGRRLGELEVRLKSRESSDDRVRRGFKQAAYFFQLVSDWMKAHYVDSEATKAVVDKVVEKMKNIDINAIAKDNADDIMRKQDTEKYLRRIDLYSDNGSRILTAVKYLSQNGEAIDLFLISELFIDKIDRDKVKFRSNAPFSTEEEETFRTAFMSLSERVGVNVRDFSWFRAMFGTGSVR